MGQIDFIVTWVKENDPDWIKSKKYYADKYDLQLNSESRYRDWGFLKYWFRSVEKYAPWVHKVYFVTEGHLPEWLNVDYEKLVVIKHSDFIAGEFLPTFNSNVIELNFGNIDNLSENFVSFNDDMFLNRSVGEEDFFKNNLPMDSGIFSPIVPIKNTIDTTVLNNVEIINEHFNKQEVIKNNFIKFFNLKYGKHIVKNFTTLPWKKFLGFYDSHIPISYNKHTFNSVIDAEYQEINKIFSNKFRTKNDLSHWLIRYWNICEGNFSPRKSSFGQYYNIGPDNEAILDDLHNDKHKVICLNDNDLLEDFDTARDLIQAEFRSKYGKKSKFEK